MKALTAIESLNASGQRVSREAVAKIIQLSPQTLNRCPKMKEILDQVVRKRRPSARFVSL